MAPLSVCDPRDYHGGCSEPQAVDGLEFRVNMGQRSMQQRKVQAAFGLSPPPRFALRRVRQPEPLLVQPEANLAPGKAGQSLLIAGPAATTKHHHGPRWSGPQA